MADDLDDILNSALDELDDEQDEEGAQAQATATTAAAAVGKGSGSCSAASSSARGATRATGAGASAASSEGEGEEGEVDDNEERELQAAIAKTIGLLGKMDAEGAEGRAGIDGMFDEAFLNKLVEEFDRLGGDGEGAMGGGNGEGMVDGMVKQLLAKDLMYPPLKEVTRQFPEWLAAHRGKTEPGAYTRYEEQYALFQRIVTVYEAPGEPDMGQLLDLMTQAQEYGQPPPEIVQALGVGPGSGLDGDGGMGGLLPPGLGLPVGPDGQPDPEACVVM